MVDFWGNLVRGVSWKCGRVVECTAFEKRHGRKVIRGSNPLTSARFAFRLVRQPLNNVGHFILMLKLFKKVWGVYKPLHKVIWFILFMMVVGIGLDLAWPYVYGRAITMVVRGANLQAILVLLLVALGTLVLQNIIGYIQAVIELKYFDYESPALAQRLTLKKLFGLSIGQHRNEHSGLTQSVIGEGQAALRDMINLVIYSFLPMGLRIPLSLIALFILSWRIGLITLTGLLIVVLIAFLQNHYFTPFVRKEREMSQELGKKRVEMIRNAPLVIANASEAYAEKMIDTETIKKDTYAKGFWKNFISVSFLVRGMVSDITLIVSIAAAAFFVSRGELGPGQVVTVVLWTSNVISNLGYLANIQRQILFASERVRKYFGILDLESDVLQKTDSVRPGKFSGGIEFRNVSFVYPRKKIVEDDVKKHKNKKAEAEIESSNGNSDGKGNAHEALHNVSLNIKPGEHVAFVGASGAGKSTTILLLLRGNDPQEGSILIDAVDLKDLDLVFYRNNLGVVEQNIVLFDDTMRRNISFGLPNGALLSDEEIEKIAKIARIDEFKDKLVDGWDTMIGENGIKLSGGQRQRVGIARALAKNPSILILDEATSSLDAKNEALIKEALQDASRGRTTIMVAHRLSTIKDADRIFVFDKGSIVGIGKHDELLETCPIYADLVSHQTVLL